MTTVGEPVFVPGFAPTLVCAAGHGTVSWLSDDVADALWAVLHPELPAAG